MKRSLVFTMQAITSEKVENSAEPKQIRAATPIMSSG
jgi:hypothetical protein